jgi:hypothetical protein
MLNPKLLTDANEDKIELETYGATNRLCRQSETERVIHNGEAVGRIDWSIGHRSWTGRINTLPANGVHGGSEIAVSRLREVD